MVASVFSSAARRQMKLSWVIRLILWQVKEQHSPFQHTKEEMKTCWFTAAFQKHAYRRRAAFVCSETPAS